MDLQIKESGPNRMGRIIHRCFWVPILLVVAIPIIGGVKLENWFRPIHGTE